jgi:flagellin
MGLRINENIAALIAQRHLRQNTARLDKVFEQLSSGERINRAGDDASGLAISQLLRSQVRSLDQALRNTEDGLSVVDTAESALGNVTNIVQRVRELALQAANDSLSVNDRAAIQLEIDAQIEEIERQAASVQFNSRNLLDGTFINQRVQLGLGPTDFLPLSIPDMRTDSLGQQAIVTGLSAVSTLPITAAVPAELVINGVAVPPSEGDGVSFSADDASAIAKANAINRVASQTGVTARADAAVHATAGAAIGTVSLDGGANSLFINGINIGAVEVVADDSSGALRNAINAHSQATGVTATVADTGELVLTAADGRNFETTTTGSVADDLGLQVGDGDLTAQVVTGRVTLTSSSDITITGSDLGLIGLDVATQSVNTVDPSTGLSGLTVTSSQDAQNAIGTTDAALDQLSRVRAALGSTANSLEATINTIQQNAQSLTSADSRIRDTDFAEATARMAREQILQQAATAILAQANLIPQMALRLLER